MPLTEIEKYSDVESRVLTNFPEDYDVCQNTRSSLVPVLNSGQELRISHLDNTAEAERERERGME